MKPHASALPNRAVASVRLDRPARYPIYVLGCTDTRNRRHPEVRTVFGAGSRRMTVQDATLQRSVGEPNAALTAAVKFSTMAIPCVEV